jgi:hypothetical protein
MLHNFSSLHSSSLEIARWWYFPWYVDTPSQAWQFLLQWWALHSYHNAFRDLCWYSCPWIAAKNFARFVCEHWKFSKNDAHLLMSSQQGFVILSALLVTAILDIVLDGREWSGYMMGAQPLVALSTIIHECYPYLLKAKTSWAAWSSQMWWVSDSIVWKQSHLTKLTELPLR